MSGTSKRQRWTDLCAQEDEIKAKRQNIWQDMKAISRRAEKEGRDLRPDEAKQWDKHERRLDAVNDELGEVQLEMRELHAELFGDVEGGAAAPSSRSTLHRGTGPLPIGGSKGRALILGPEQRMSDLYPRDENTRDLSLARYVRGLVTGQWDGAEAEHRVMVEGTDSAGGYAVPAPLAAEVIDLARAKARVTQAGARVVPMESKTLTVPRVTDGVSAAWRAENDAVTFEDMTLDALELDAKSLAIGIKMSVELAEDITPAGEQAILNDIAQAIALGFDGAALYGTGASNQPEGVKTNANVTKVALGANGATPTDYSPLVDGVAAVRQANQEPTAAIYAPRTGKTFGTLTATDGQPLQRPRYLDGVAELETSQVPTNLTVGTSGATTSDIFVGDWSQLYLGIRRGFTLRVLKERFADNLQVALVADLRGDIGVARSSAFWIQTAVTAS